MAAAEIGADRRSSGRWVGAVGDAGHENLLPGGPGGHDPEVSSQRQFPRYAIDAQVTVRDPAGAMLATGRTGNLSRGGVCADFDTDLPRGVAVKTEITLVFDAEHSSEPLVIPARVVWSTAMGPIYQIGLAFIGLGAEQLRYLDMFMRFLDAPDTGDGDDGDDDDGGAATPDGLPFDT